MIYIIFKLKEFMNFSLENFDYNLPQNLIAQKPHLPKDKCKLMVVNKNQNKLTSDNFFNLDKYLSKNDVLVFNDSKVLPARLTGEKLTGGKIEVLLLKQLSTNTWEALVKVKNNKVGLEFILYKNKKQPLKAKIIDRKNEIFVLEFNLKGQKLLDKILEIGQIPTPPYIKRLAKDSEYQTIYAKKIGSAAAPTAGLHFTQRIFKKLKQKGVQIEFVTLHVGLGTFKPVEAKDIRKHKIHSEYFELSSKTAQRINKAKQNGKRIIPVGTTALRVLETCAEPVRNPALVRHPEPACPAGGLISGSQANSTNYVLTPKSGYTSIYIYPGYKFKITDALITNFHLPKSSLLMLVSALAGNELIMKAYKKAIKEKYKFFSFGDAMFIA